MDDEIEFFDELAFLCDDKHDYREVLDDFDHLIWETGSTEFEYISNAGRFNWMTHEAWQHLDEEISKLRYGTSIDKEDIKKKIAAFKKIKELTTKIPDDDLTEEIDKVLGDIFQVAKDASLKVYDRAL